MIWEERFGAEFLLSQAILTNFRSLASLDSHTINILNYASIKLHYYVQRVIILSSIAEYLESKIYFTVSCGKSQ